MSVYRSANQSADNPKDTIDGVAPYWRLAGERQWGPHALEIGTYGLSVKVHDNGTGGPTNDFLDTAVDLQYQHLTDDRALTVRSTFINEDQDWAAGGSTKLQTFRVNASYLLDHRAGGSLGYFSTTGDRNPALYQPAAVDGSRNGDPDSAGWIAELDYLPWENTRFTLQYVAYDKFNGASSNYDGAGRDASDNNTVFLNAWLNY